MPYASECVAAGYYGPQGAVRNLAETLSAGAWTPAQPTQPSLGLADPNPSLNAVSCPATGTCVAAGLYDDQNSDSHGLIESLSSGTWTATEPPAPPGAATGFDAGLYGVSCPTSDTCVAVGGYGDQHGIAQAMTEPSPAERDPGRSSAAGPSTRAAGQRSPAECQLPRPAAAAWPSGITARKAIPVP